MTNAAFIDTNVLLRHLLQDDPDQSARATFLFLEAESGRFTLHASETVIFEAVYVLHKQYDIPKREIKEGLLDVLNFSGVAIPNSGPLQAALSFWTQHGGLSFADCFHLALAKELGMTAIYTFDKKMDRYPGVERIEL